MVCILTTHDAFTPKTRFVKLFLLSYSSCTFEWLLRPTCVVNCLIFMRDRSILMVDAALVKCDFLSQSKEMITHDGGFIFHFQIALCAFMHLVSGLLKVIGRFSLHFGTLYHAN